MVKIGVYHAILSLKFHLIIYKTTTNLAYLHVKDINGVIPPAIPQLS